MNKLDQPSCSASNFSGLSVTPYSNHSNGAKADLRSVSKESSSDQWGTFAQKANCALTQG